MSSRLSLSSVPSKRVLVGVLVVALGAVGCSSSHSQPRSKRPTSASPPVSSPRTPSNSPSPAAGGSLAAYYRQKLDWKGCGTAQCATLRVPLDYAKPAARKISIAVLKVPAQDQAHKVGALVVNPGGPGGSGVDYAAAGSLAFGPRLPKAFDLIGFDPRGVGRSTPLRCASTAQLDQLVGFNPAPSTTAERHQMDALVHAFGVGCLKRSGDLAKHMSTVEAAKDMDILRAALGEKKLTYFGASYGTFLGATYANLFPHRVNRMVLDGAIDPALSNQQLSLAQGHGFEVALRSYVANCVQAGGCFLGNTVDAGINRIHQFLDSTVKKPLPTDTGRQLTSGWAVLGVWLPLYVKSYWPRLSDGLRQAMHDQNGSTLMSLADQYASRGPKGYTDNSLEALYAVNCLDHDDYIASSNVRSHYQEFLKASPTFGTDFAYGLSTCSTWPVKTHRSTHALHAKGAPPIVVVGTTRDPATPVAWAKALAHELDSGVLVTRNGDGHTGFNEGNACVDNAVVDYLTRGVVPKDGLAC
ncbi:MAG: alpha/beta hydrolase [Actinomycetota bacterium]|nr:alpha/beta hydrolase [Actinomycetota bacterium]